jgi:hypothetical protein
MAKEARAAMKAKAQRLGSSRPTEKVDSSTWSPAELLNADVKTGLRPVSRRQFKKGGKVMGAANAPRADRKPRKSGGGTEATAEANAKINRNVKAANEERPGIKHVGAMKKGGAAKRKKYATEGGVDDIGALIENLPDTGNMPPVEDMVMRKRGSSAQSSAGDLSPRDAARMQQLLNQSARESAAEDRAAMEREAYKVRGYKKGGRSKKAVGGPQTAAQRMMQQAQDTAGVTGSRMNFQPVGQGKLSPMKAAGAKKGGMIKHDDVKADKALIKKMVKPSAMRKGKEGGGLLGGTASTLDPIGTPKAIKDPLNLGKGVTDPAGIDSPLKRGGKAKRKAHATRGRTKTEDQLDAEYAMRGPDEAMRSIVYGGRPPVKTMGGIPTPISRGDMQALQDMRDSRPTQSEMPGISGGEYSRPSQSEFDQMQQLGNSSMKKGGRAKRKDGGGVFSGPGYPGKIPGVVPGGRTARATGGKTKGKTNINIVIAQGKHPGQPGMMPPGGPMGKPPGGIPVPVPPPGAGPGAGMGAPAGIPMPFPMPVPSAAGATPPAGGLPLPRKAGGRISKIASSYKDMTAGSAGGEGRLQKTDIAKKGNGAPAFKKGGKVYRSYKDMDAGSASGLGRLEKSEIAARKG